MVRSIKKNYMMMTPKKVYGLIVKGELKKFPNNYLDVEVVYELVRYVFLGQLHFTREDVCSKLDYHELQKYYLGGTRKLFDCSMYELISYCFPEMHIKYWELKKVGSDFWKDEKNLTEFMEYIFKAECIDVDSIEDVRKVNAKLIDKYGGSKPLLYGKGTFGLVSLVTKQRYKEWQAGKVNCWNEQKAISAVKWLIEEKLNYTPDDVCEKLGLQDFVDNNLDGMLSKFCNHSILQALNLAYPGCYYREKRNHMYHI